MSKFAIGDNVVCSSTSYGDKQGTKGKVVELIGEASFVKAELENGETYCDVLHCFLHEGEKETKPEVRKTALPKVSATCFPDENYNPAYHLHINQKNPSGPKAEFPDEVVIMNHIWDKEENSVELDAKRYVLVEDMNK